jgi:hypothetical protein
MDVKYQIKVHLFYSVDVCLFRVLALSSIVLIAGRRGERSLNVNCTSHSSAINVITQSPSCQPRSFDCLFGGVTDQLASSQLLILHLYRSGSSSALQEWNRLSRKAAIKNHCWRRHERLLIRGVGLWMKTVWAS